MSIGIIARNKETQVLEKVPIEQQDDDLKKKLAKNNEAKMVLYNALPKKEYERIFMCKTAKESIDSGFVRFNTIITSLKTLDEGFSCKNYLRKFLRALDPKWRAKVITIEESKDLSSLALDELIGNLKVHEVVMKKDSKIYRGKKEKVKSIALKAKKESSDDETSTSGSDDEEYAMTVRNFKKFFRRKGKFVRQPREEKKSFRQSDEKKGRSDRKCFRCGDPNHLIGDCPKQSRNKERKAFIGGSWRDSENDAEDKTNDETCLMAKSSNELKNINKYKILKAKRQLLEKEILKLNKKIKKLKRSKEIEIACKSCDELKFENAKLKVTQVKFVKFDKSANSLREMLINEKLPSCKIGLGFDSDKASTSGTKTMSFIGSSAKKRRVDPPFRGTDPPYLDPKAYVVLNKHTIKVKESLNVTFDESSPPTKLSPLVDDDDVGEEESIRKNTKIVNTNNEEDELIEINEIVNIKESKNHPLEQVIGNLNQRTLRSQAKDVKEALNNEI
uniref:CCHC-type domain-containing protein n=1 Tax=Tanacetum cinerariifolium TaxID=118510 RepID=A0A6L2J3Q2_TANCI|nr:hypothetical protein [Tanacetum cinerariifolium]